MPTRSSRRVVLPSFNRFSSSLVNTDSVHFQKTDTFCYAITYCESGSFEESTNKFTHFPVVINRDGSVWREAAYYIYHRLSVDAASNQTVYAVALDLALFRRFLDENDLAFDFFPDEKLFRPTYRYKIHLKYLVKLNSIEKTTASRRMSSVVRFYEWIRTRKLINLNGNLWEEKVKWGSDPKGSSNRRKLTARDVSIRSNKAKDREAVYDGGELYPLSYSQQGALLRRLIVLGNVEMLLIHLIAIFTGARIQTILTLRVGMFKSDSLTADESRIIVGAGSLTDSKNDKKLSIYFPVWLIERVLIYIESPSAVLRRSRSRRALNHDSQYVFLSNRGEPYYESSKDPEVYPSAAVKEGQAIRQFMYDRVFPGLDLPEGGFRYKFHDLRATYGVNLTNKLLNIMEQGGLQLSDVREIVRESMGHESYETTDRYIRYSRIREYSYLAIDKYEEHLKAIALGAFNGV